MNINQNALNKNIRRLSSGYRINSAADDPARLSVSEGMRSQISGLNIAQNNAQDQISFIQTVGGMLSKVHSMLIRMKELSVQLANSIYESGTDRVNMNKEFESLKDEINRITDLTTYNKTKILNSSNPSKKECD